MIILKTLLSGGDTTTLLNDVNKEVSTRQISEGVAKPRTTEDQKDKTKKMEFMYCIPDLEVFIDKTIKKCLLEYDLDANDTEAVLDDMEKAWPKSPPRSSEKQVLKDCNDNTEKGRGGRQLPAVSQVHDGGLSDGTLDKSAIKNDETSMQREKSKGRESRALSDIVTVKEEERGEPLSNWKKEAVRDGEDGSRSGSSSPDVGEGKTQARTHPKLKSRLQQRYFEGRQSPGDGTGQERNNDDSNNNNNINEDETWGPSRHASSNLDLLASAANIHTETARRNEEQRLEAIRRLQEDSVRKFHEDMARQATKQTNFQNGFAATTTTLSSLNPAATALNGLGRTAVTLSELGRTTTTLNASQMPHLLKLMSAKPASSSPSSSPSSTLLSSGSSLMPLQYNQATNHLNGSNVHNNLRMTGPGSGHSLVTVTPQSDTRPLTTSSGRPGEERVISFVDRDRAQLLLQHYQNGYHALIPRETVVVRRELPRDGEEMGSGRSQLSTGAAPSSWNIVNDKETAGSQYRNVSQSPRFHPSHGIQHHSEVYHDHFHRHGSRIASIIAEELQKDNDGKLETSSSSRNIPSIDRIITPEMKPLASQEPRRVKQIQPGFSRRGTSMEHRPSPAPAQTQRDMYHAVSAHESSISHTRPMHQLLPAHIFPDNAHSGSATLPSHMRLSPVVSGGSGRAEGYTSGVIYDEQPQDLSTKSRTKASEDVSEHEGQYFSSSNPDSPVTDRGTRGYFSSPSSPLSLAAASVSHTESSTFRKSVSPSNNSDKECDYSSGREGGSNPLRTSGKWERKGQVHGLDILPAGAKDSKILAEKRRMEALKRWSDARDGEMNKRRDIQ